MIRNKQQCFNMLQLFDAVLKEFSKWFYDHPIYPTSEKPQGSDDANDAGLVGSMAIHGHH